MCYLGNTTAEEIYIPVCNSEIEYISSLSSLCNTRILDHHPLPNITDSPTQPHRIFSRLPAALQDSHILWSAWGLL